MADLAAETGYRLVADDLRNKIEAGTYPVGSRLPSLRKIEKHYGVSNDVARRAVGRLRDEGLVVVAQGLGTQIVAKPSDIPPEPEIGEAIRLVAELRDEVRKHGEEIADLREKVEQLQPPRAAGPVQPGSRRPRQTTPRPAS